VATTGIVLAALYVLIAYQRTMQGPVRAGVESFRDLDRRELAVITPLLALIVVMGVYPKPILDIIKPSVTATYDQANRTDPPPLDVAAPAAQSTTPTGAGQ
jgi:NADH-quinone oxidoreductase subunit M